MADRLRQILEIQDHRSIDLEPKTSICASVRRGRRTVFQGYLGSLTKIFARGRIPARSERMKVSDRLTLF